MVNVLLQLQLEDDPEIIDRDTRRLLSNIADTVDPVASLATTESEPDARTGDAVLLGEVAMTLLSSGTVVALLEIVKAYFNRKRSGSFAVTRADGASIAIEMDDVSDEQFDRTVDRVFGFCGDDP